LKGGQNSGETIVTSNENAAPLLTCACTTCRARFESARSVRLQTRQYWQIVFQI
jgi:hypothetical protein